MAGAVLSREQILGLISSDRPLIRDFVSLADQVQPNGFDLTVTEVRRFQGAGVIGISNADRQLPDLVQIEPDQNGYLTLEPGPYHITFREIVSLPNSLMAFGRPRSSLNRSGVTVHTAVWDAGYTGRSTSLLSVLNPDGFRLQIGARVLQLVFVELLSAAREGYQGIYLGENI